MPDKIYFVDEPDLDYGWMLLAVWPTYEQARDQAMSREEETGLHHKVTQCEFGDSPSTCDAWVADEASLKCLWSEAGHPSGCGCSRCSGHKDYCKRVHTW